MTLLLSDWLLPFQDQFKMKMSSFWLQVRVWSSVTACGVYPASKKELSRA